jgi:hypothetical protein
MEIRSMLKSGWREQQIREFYDSTGLSRETVERGLRAVGIVSSTIVNSTTPSNERRVEPGKSFDLTTNELVEYYRLLRLYRDRKRSLGLRGRYKFGKDSKVRLLYLINKRLDYYSRQSSRNLEVFERFDKANAEKIRKELLRNKG